MNFFGRGKQHPNSLSCDVPSATPSYLASMIDRVVLECDENAEVKDTLKKNAVICSEFFTFQSQAYAL